MLNQTRRHGLAAAAMILALGFSLILGGCGRNNQNGQNSANQSTTPQGTTSTSTPTSGGGSTTGNAASSAQDLQNLSDSLNGIYSDIATDATSATTDYSQLDQEVNP